jgi:hypothetical protein
MIICFRARAALEGAVRPRCGCGKVWTDMGLPDGAVLMVIPKPARYFQSPARPKTTKQVPDCSQERGAAKAHPCSALWLRPMGPADGQTCGQSEGVAIATLGPGGRRSSRTSLMVRTSNCRDSVDTFA